MNNTGTLRKGTPVRESTVTSDMSAYDLLPRRVRLDLMDDPDNCSAEFALQALGPDYLRYLLKLIKEIREAYLVADTRLTPRDVYQQYRAFGRSSALDLIASGLGPEDLP